MSETNVVDLTSRIERWRAPEGQIWLCPTCGLRTKNLTDPSPEWTDSCIMQAVLCDEVQPAPGFYALSREETKT